jgi:ferredoxin
VRFHFVSNKDHNTSLLVCEARADSGPAYTSRLKITFKEASGKVIKTVEANEGDDILSIAHEHDIDLEGASSVAPLMSRRCSFSPLTPLPRLLPGACERSCACSTCHVILDPDVYDTLPEPTDEENDMLDLAFGLTDTCVLPSPRLASDLCRLVWLTDRAAAAAPPGPV